MGEDSSALIYSAGVALKSNSSDSIRIAHVPVTSCLVVVVVDSSSSQRTRELYVLTEPCYLKKIGPVPTFPRAD